jgi:hypothetical protein
MEGGLSRSGGGYGGGRCRRGKIGSRVGDTDSGGEGGMKGEVGGVMGEETESEGGIGGGGGAGGGRQRIGMAKLKRLKKAKRMVHHCVCYVMFYTEIICTLYHTHTHTHTHNTGRGNVTHDVGPGAG